MRKQKNKNKSLRGAHPESASSGRRSRRRVKTASRPELRASRPFSEKPFSRPQKPKKEFLDVEPRQPKTPSYEWRVKRSEHGMSLENFIYRQLGDWSHKQIKDAIDHKRAFVNGRNVFVSKWNVKHNDLVRFVPSAKEGPTSVLQRGRYRFVELLHDDPYVIVANKPAFVDHEGFALTVADFLRRQTGGTALAYVGQMHRLDKETSGAMVFTKKKIANTLADQFRDHSIRKVYLAVVEGLVDPPEGVIKKALQKGRFDEGKKVRIAEDEDDGMMAETHFRVVERYLNASLLRLEIKTGRTHQIRIHMADLGHPLIGDKVYGNKRSSGFRRQALHAESLEFRHPITGKKIRALAPLPTDMVTLIDQLRNGESV